MSLPVISDALTFDDVLLMPGYSEIMPKEVSLANPLCSALTLYTPMISSAMDTVTEAPMAIAMAEHGGLGIIHKNLSIEEQALQVRTVKKFESGVVNDPITISEDATWQDVEKICAAYNFSALPVTTPNNELIGISTNRDRRFVTDPLTPVKDMMTPKERLVTVKEGADRAEVISLCQKHRIEKVLVVTDAFELKGMITVKDILRSQDNPWATKDSAGRLMVGAAVGVGEAAQQRVAALINANVDVLVVDTAHGHTKSVIEQVKWIKTQYPHVIVIAGNIATAEAALALKEAGADVVKVGMGPGSICTTRIVAGIGVPQITAVNNVAEALKGTGIGVIADGGLRFSGDIAKAMAAGASAVMVGGLLAGTDESPGDVVLYQGRSYKSYRGMGSLGAMHAQHGSADRYFQDKQDQQSKYIPEGIEGRVPYKGSLSAVVTQLMGGLRSSMGYLGAATIADMQKKARFVRVSAAGMQESHVHDVFITKEAPNYSVEKS